jgi:hypothetical protein
MAKRITVTLTEDQANAILNIIDEFELSNGVRSYMEMTPEQKKVNAFLKRIKTAFQKAELVR